MSPFDQLRREFPAFKGPYAPPWGLPTEQDFARIEARLGQACPASFKALQTQHALHLPSFPDGLRWANAGLEPYLSLENLIDEVRASPAPAHFLPFADDESDYIGFVIDGSKVEPGPAVARWDHAGETLGLEADNFENWLRRQYAQHAQRYTHGE